MIASSAPLFEIRSPLWLLVFLPAALCVVYYWRSSLVDTSPRRRWQSMIVRLALLAALSISLAGPYWNRPNRDRCFVLLVDRSASVGEVARTESERQIEAFREACPRSDRIIRIDFAAETSNPRRLDASASTAPIETTASDTLESRKLPVDGSALNAMGTDLASALSLAESCIPDGYSPHIILFSDGNATTGNVMELATGISAPVSTVALPDRATQEVQVSNIRAPLQSNIGEPFDVEITLNSNHATRAQIELFRDQFKVDIGSQANVQIQPGESVIRIRQQLDEARTTTFTARVIAETDHQLNDNSASTMTIVAGQPRLLLIDEDPDSLESLRWALEDHQMTVDVRPAAGLPTSLTELLSFDLIGLSDVPATQLKEQQLQNLATYVTELGGGLVMLGSDNSFGLGGYYRTPLEAVLPVSSQIEQEREKPSLAMLLVIDRSGSMGGQKLALAKDASKAAVELLTTRDQIGIVAFDDDAYWVSQLEAATNKPTIIDRIDRLEAAGGTNMYPAMEKGLEALLESTAKIKHMLILGDGISSPADFLPLTRRIVEQQITVSTVALGDKADRPLLRTIAEQGAGRHYVCEDPRSVPQVFARETMLAGGSAVDEEPFLPRQVRSSKVLRGIDVANAPLLLGTVATKVKPTSEVILATPNGDPLLAWWRHGIGMTLAFTSDAKPRWAVEWLAWPDFPNFWAQCVRHVARSDQSQLGEVKILRDPESAQLVVDLTNEQRQFVNQAKVLANVIDPDDQRIPIQLSQVAAGRYNGRFKTPKRGAYQVDITAFQDGNKAAFFRTTKAIVVGYSPELRLQPTNKELLSNIAKSTGGRFEVNPVQLLSNRRTAGQIATALWPWFACAAAVLLLIDTLFRRLGTTS